MCHGYPITQHNHTEYRPFPWSACFYGSFGTARAKRRYPSPPPPPPHLPAEDPQCVRPSFTDSWNPRNSWLYISSHEWFDQGLPFTPSCTNARTKSDQRLRRWPDLERAFGRFPPLAYCLHMAVAAAGAGTVLLCITRTFSDKLTIQFSFRSKLFREKLN